jgi:hypothetical protein
MKIILFRHGPAESRDPERWPDDAERPLTPRGEKRTRLAALEAAHRAQYRTADDEPARAPIVPPESRRVLDIDPVETLDVPSPGSVRKIEALNSAAGGHHRRRRSPAGPGNAGGLLPSTPKRRS